MSKKNLFLLVLTLSITTIGIFAVQPAQAAGCDGANIIFSELDYDQPGTDSSEFLELYIPSGTTITDCEIRFVNGSNGSEYNITSIAGTYTAGEYLWLGAGGDITIGSCGGSNCIQNGAPDGFALVDTSGSGTLVWFYSYEGQINGYDPGDGSSNSSTDIGVSESNGDNPNESLVNGPAAGVGDTTTSTNPTPGAANQDDGGSPTAVSLQSITASTQPTGLILITFTLLLLAMGGVWMRLRRR